MPTGRASMFILLLITSAETTQGLFGEWDTTSIESLEQDSIKIGSISIDLNLSSFSCTEITSKNKTSGDSIQASARYPKDFVSTIQVFGPGGPVGPVDPLSP